MFHLKCFDFKKEEEVETTSVLIACQMKNELRRKESNLHLWVMSPTCYRYTTAQYFKELVGMTGFEPATRFLLGALRRPALSHSELHSKPVMEAGFEPA